MSRAIFDFHAELNDFLSKAGRGAPVEQDFNANFPSGNPSIKHMVEAIGVPHTEVGRILVNGSPAGFSYQVQDNDRIEVFPLTPEERLNRSVGGETGDKEPRFLLDNHLGKLAVYLRIAGFDVLYRNDFQDPDLAEISGREGRVLLTRDQKLLMRSVVTEGYWVREKSPPHQLREILERFNLYSLVHPFQRCLRCNTLLQPVVKEAVLPRLEPLTKKYFDEFHYCPVCDQVYWKGSHYERMQEFLNQVVRDRQL